jgi:sialate O-acetylesterase
MVLQRAPQRAIVWGYTDAFNAPITLTMDGKIYQTMSSSTPSNDVAAQSVWSVSLDPQPAEGPFQVKVTKPLANGTLETITLDDVLFGDVWICSGQSNMEFSVTRMFNASVEIENAYKYPKIRLFTAAKVQSHVPLEELAVIGLNWSVASNATLSNIEVSAVCWLYGRMVQEALGGRPMGLIHSSWGGTGIEFWSLPQALEECGIKE